MTLSDVAINRPVFTTMIILAIVVLGTVSFFEIGVDLFPRVEFPVITIVSVLPAADPETVETTVTDPIEQAVSTIGAIKHLRSTSAEGVSQVVIEFDLNKDINVAQQEVQAKIASVRADLPRDLEEPVIEKFDIDAAPVLAIVLSGDMPIRQLTRIADKTVKERIQRVPNVGQVKLVGGRDRQIWIWLDASKLAGYFVTVQDVILALQTQHAEIPGGRIETGPTEYVVRTKAEFASAAEIERMIVSTRDGATVRVSDLGRVEDGLEEERSMARLDGVQAVALLVRRQSGTNTIQVADAVKKELEALKQELAPQGIRVQIAQDQSTYIQQSVHEMQFHLLFGGGLAILIVFVFLRNLRSTFISSLVLPTSIIGTFIMMNALGFTQNMMTLLALSLAIGLLIDDAIVGQENIMRYIEHGYPPREAASRGTREITLAVLATTFSVMAVFVPVAFMEGQVGRFFYQFGLTVTFAIAISLYVAFTLDPMLSSRILRKPRPNGFYELSERAFSLLDRGYGLVLRGALRLRLVVVVLTIACFAVTLNMAQYLRSEFVPLEDQSEFTVRVKGPLGASLQSTDLQVEEIRKRLETQPWLEYTFAKIGADDLQRVNEGEIYVRMRDKRARSVTQAQAMDWTRENTKDISGAKVSVEIVHRVSGGGFKTADVQLELRGPDLDTLDRIAMAAMEKMRSTEGYVDVDTSYEHNKPEVNLYVNREAAADLGVSPGMIASSIRALIGGEDVAKFRAEGDRYDISVRLETPFRNTPDRLQFLTLRTDRGQMVRIQNVATVREEAGPVQIDRNNRTRQITVYANLQPEKKVLGEAVTELTQVVNAMKLPSGYTFGFAGMADNMREGFANLIFALVLSVVFIYMVLAAQFESFVHPFTIMLAIPLSITGAIAALLLTGMTVSIYTMIGIIMLMGLVTKNGILLVDYTNTLRRRDGLDCKSAILQAGPVRLRPILMTTLAIVFGMLPIALGTGEGSESRAPMAVAVIGGLIISTLLTLIVVPVVYSLLDGVLSAMKRRIAPTAAQ